MFRYATLVKLIICSAGGMRTSLMSTVVCQSYRPSYVPVWIELCMATVRSWASSQGFDYRFIDDELFEYAPQWYRRKVSDDILLMSDLARLVVARRLLGEGYRR